MNDQNNQPQEELSTPEGIEALNEEQLENVIGAGESLVGRILEKCVSCIAPKTNEGGLQLQFHHQKLDPETKTLLNNPVHIPMIEGTPATPLTPTREQKTAYAREFNPFTGAKVQPH